MSTERENNFTWALQRLTGLFFRRDVYPTVIVSDRDLTLMNVIEVIQSDRHLTKWHMKCICVMMSPLNKSTHEALVRYLITHVA